MRGLDNSFLPINSYLTWKRLHEPLIWFLQDWPEAVLLHQPVLKRRMLGRLFSDFCLSVFGRAIQTPHRWKSFYIFIISANWILISMGWLRIWALVMLDACLIFCLTLCPFADLSFWDTSVNKSSVSTSTGAFF